MYVLRHCHDDCGDDFPQKQKLHQHNIGLRLNIVFKNVSRLIVSTGPYTTAYPVGSQFSYELTYYQVITSSPIAISTPITIK